MNNNKIPIVTIHNGDQPYFKKLLELNSRYNSNIIVLTDCDKKKENGINFVNYNNLKVPEIKVFKTSYEHLNTTPFDYEIFCYLRWFIILEFMKKNNYETIFHIDSDVLVFSDPDEEFEKYKYFDFTLTHRTTASSSFFTLKGLEKFCDFMLDLFLDKNKYEYQKIASHFHVRQKFNLPGGVCDMTFFHNYDYKMSGLIGEMMYIVYDSTYDHNINDYDNVWDFKNGIKQFNFIEGFPYCYNKKLKKKIKINSIHLQGGAKNFIFQIENFLNN
jgi:hypothetical protein